MAQFKVYFIGGHDGEREIATTESFIRAWEAICEFCDDRSFVVNYMRRWESSGDSNCLVVDVGSHTQYFHIYRTLDEVEEHRIGYLEDEMDVATSQLAKYKHKADFYFEKQSEKEHEVEEIKEAIKNIKGW